jgi:predicted dinucleotide-utilizing enzyme
MRLKDFAFTGSFLYRRSPRGRSADLLAAAPDMIIEAASREAVREWGDTALRVARQFVVSSTGAFVDERLLNRLRNMAKRCRSQLVLPSGALAGARTSTGRSERYAASDAVVQFMLAHPIEIGDTLT